MNRVFYSLVFMFAVVAALFIFQATRGTVALVLLPSELAELQGKSANRIRVAGRVTNSEIEYEVQPNFILKFSIENPPQYDGTPIPQSKSIPVVYNNVKPDMFAPGRDVIIDGDFSNGVLTANNLLTQCPSKYEPAKPDGAIQPNQP